MGKMKTAGLLLILLIAFAWLPRVGLAGALPEGLLSGKVPAEFPPAGWTVEDQASGDLNGDGIADTAAILVESKPEGEQDEAADEPQRALVILLGHEGGKPVSAGANGKLLQCKGCGGVKEMEGIGIRKGVVIVDQMTGSREFARQTWRFRYDPGSKRFVLIGKDLETGDGMRGTGTIESYNYLTGRKITEKYRYDKDGEHRIALSTKEEKEPPKTLFMEDVEPEY